MATKNLTHIGPIMLTYDFISKLPKFALSKRRDRKPLGLKHDRLNTKQPIKVHLVALMDSVKGRLKDGLDSFRVGNSWHVGSVLCGLSMLSDFNGVF